MKNKNIPFFEMEFTTDEYGKEILLKDHCFQVMMEWEKPYMQACVDALSPSGDVLEVGFGCGYASTHIQSYHPKSHTIIECHPVVAERAREWAKQYQGVTIIEDTWQNALSHLGVFDAIFFDDYPLQAQEKLDEMIQEKENSSLILKAGQKKMKEIENQFSFIKTMKYTDRDLEEFLNILSSEAYEPMHLLRFFSDLKDADNITSLQFEKIIQHLQKEKILSSQDIETFQKSKQPKEAASFEFEERGDRLFEFLQLCLQKHMKKGARFSCYLNDPTSKFLDEKFYQHIILNPYLEYREKTVPVHVPPNCQYYTADQALVITITKMN